MTSRSDTPDNFYLGRNAVTGVPVTLTPRAVAIAGRSGSGKSVLIQRFALQYASSGGGFIVFDSNAGAAAAGKNYLRVMGLAGRERDLILIDFDDREIRGSTYSSGRCPPQALARELVQRVMSKTEVSFEEVLEHKKCAMVCLPSLYPPAFNQAVSRAIFDDLAGALRGLTRQGRRVERFSIGLDEPFFLWAETDAAEDLGKISEAAGAVGIGLVLTSHSSYRLGKSWPTRVVLGSVLDRDLGDVLDFLCPSADETFATSDIPAALRSLKPREALVVDAHRLTRVSLPNKDPAPGVADGARG